MVSDEEMLRELEKQASCPESLEAMTALYSGAEAEMWRPKVYLAGKIEVNCWRHGLVHELRCMIHDGYWENFNKWPVMNRALFGAFDYTGPYFVGDDHGCGHRNGLHGLTEPGDDCVCVAAPCKPDIVHRLCLEAIDRSDLIFAWIDKEDCYGTIAELGYAAGRGKRIAVACPAAFSSDEHWFVFQLDNTLRGGKKSHHQRFESPKAALLQAIKSMRPDFDES